MQLRSSIIDDGDGDDGLLSSSALLLLLLQVDTAAAAAAADGREGTLCTCCPFSPTEASQGRHWRAPSNTSIIGWY